MTWLNVSGGEGRIADELYKPGARSLAIAHLFLFFVLATPASAQELPTEFLLETRLRPVEVQEGDNFGGALAFDGDTLVVAAPWAGINGIARSGAVYVYRHDPASGEWLEHQRLMPADGNYDSVSMSVAIDDETIVVGAHYATLAEYQEGAVYIFERDASDDTWYEIKKLTDLSVGFGGHFGVSVALAGDLLAVGADMQPTITDGKVTLFERHRGGTDHWGEVTTLYGSVVGDGGTLEAFGSAIAIAGDELLVGAERADVSGYGENDGAAYLFSRNEADRDQWDYVARFIAPGSDDCVGGQTLTEFFTNPDSDTGEADRCRRDDSQSDHDYFGGAVSFDGDTIVVGVHAAEGDDGSLLVGAAYAYERDATDTDRWTVTELIPDSADPFGYFGKNVVVQDNTILVAATGNGGAVHVFARDDDGAWHTSGLLAVDGFSDDSFGEALDFDGTKVAVGANGEDVFRGAAYVFAAEDASTDPVADWQPPFAITDELVASGVVEHDSGLDIRADAGSLLGPLPIWIHEVPAPSPLLPPDVKVHGSFFNIGAIRTKFTEQDKPLTVSFPVPDDADNEHLGIAVLTAHNSFFSEPPPSLISWGAIAGQYDSIDNRFSITLSALSAFGTTFALVEHSLLGAPDLDDERVAIGRLDVGFGASSAGAKTETNPDIDISVTCSAFDPCADAPKEQMDQEVATLKEYALEEFGRYRRVGYEKLHLREEEIDGVFTYGTVFLSHIPCSDQRSQYKPLAQYIHICKGETEDYRRIMAHEMFHAVQHSFSGFRADLETLFNSLSSKYPDSEDGEELQFELERDTKWIREGTARAAENSAEEMIRAGGEESVGLHILVNSLKRYANRSEPRSEHKKTTYKAQDFWVYFGKKRSLGLGYLSGFFATGATTAAVAKHIADEYGTTLGDEYWEFAKNQFTENATDISIESDGARPPDCKKYLMLVGAQRMRDEKTDRYVQDPETGRVIWVPTYQLEYPAETTKTVEELWDLSSNVVEITFTEDITTTLQVAGEPSQGGAAGKHKVYLDRAPDTENNQCRQVSDGDRTIGTEETGPIKAGDKVYVLVSNLHFDRNEPISYKVTVTPPG